MFTLQIIPPPPWPWSTMWHVLTILGNNLYYSATVLIHIIEHVLQGARSYYKCIEFSISCHLPRLKNFRPESYTHFG